ncbi:uncharacterized protein IWZ02DRAFT_180789 [Phyllosticta citriasiana]|uniref:uncharacterized protein n=1 Tax=Phyllosticta citriasiana TaxID=595635 RepID=UPI0030FD88B8
MLSLSCLALLHSVLSLPTSARLLSMIIRPSSRQPAPKHSDVTPLLHQSGCHVCGTCHQQFVDVPSSIVKTQLLPNHNNHRPARYLVC